MRHPIAVVLILSLGYSAFAQDKSAVVDGNRRLNMGKPASTDCYGDSLPEAALARFGTVRLRQETPIFSLAFSADGKLLASGGGNNEPGFGGLGGSTTGYGSVHLWDATTGKERKRFLGHQGIIRSLSFSPDSKLLASAGDDGCLYIWQVSTGKELCQLP